MKITDSIFEQYCYGPVDLVQIYKGSNTMWLELLDSVGRRARAVYRGCIYWRLEPEQIGLHLSMVQKVSARELLARQGSVTLLALRKNTDDVAGLLHQWEQEGLSFYLHLGSQPEMEFLVAAKSLDYQELE